MARNADHLAATSAAPTRSVMMRPCWIGLAVASLMLATTACGARLDSPNDAASSYVEAVQDGDADRVYDMLDDSSRHGMDREEFLTFFEENRELLLSQAAALDEVAEVETIPVSAEVPLSARHSARLSYVDGQWYVADALPVSRGQETPRETLEAFITALDDRNFEAILPLLSNERRSAYVGELRALRNIVSESIKNGIVTRGDRAVLPLNNGDKIILVREAGLWKIQEFEQTTR